MCVHYINENLLDKLIEKKLYFVFDNCTGQDFLGPITNKAHS
jgi:hypothetical protein